MKAVVVDITGKHAIVLSKDGQFIKIKNYKSYEVGAEVEIPSVSMLRPNGFMMKTVAAAAAFVFTVGVAYGAYSYNMPYSYVDIDINPSVELVANRYDRILKAEAINDDGAKVLENKSYINKTVSYAVEEIIKNASEKGYIKEDVSSAVMLTVSSKNEKKAEDVEKKVQEKVLSEMDSAGVDADIVIGNVSIERHDEARSLNISPGKLVLIEKLQDVAPEIKLDDYRNTPVKEIMKAIDERKKESQKEDREDLEEQKAKEPDGKKDKDEPKSSNEQTGNMENKVIEPDKNSKNDNNGKNDKVIEIYDEKGNKNEAVKKENDNSKTGLSNNNKDKKNNTNINSTDNNGNGKGKDKKK